jgi:hypothetical protein
MQPSNMNELQVLEFEFRDLNRGSLAACRNFAALGHAALQSGSKSWRAPHAQEMLVNIFPVFCKRRSALTHGMIDLVNFSRNHF